MENSQKYVTITTCDQTFYSQSRKLSKIFSPGRDFCKKNCLENLTGKVIEWSMLEHKMTYFNSNFAVLLAKINQMTTDIYLY